MSQIDNIRDILEAIKSVRVRAKEAMAKGDLAAYTILMQDLVALEQCLVYQSEALVKEAA